MFSLLPKETVFFDLFEEAAKNAHQGAQAPQDLLNDFRNVGEKAKRIKDIEHAGDKLTHTTIEKLNQTFITPLDREDIHELICRIDDILDLIDTAGGPDVPLQDRQAHRRRQGAGEGPGRGDEDHHRAAAQDAQHEAVQLAASSTASRSTPRRTRGTGSSSTRWRRSSRTATTRSSSSSGRTSTRSWRRPRTAARTWPTSSKASF
jgi:hypothetical protein